MKKMKIFVLSIVEVLLLCSVTSAVDVTPFLKISREYAANPSRARKEWIGKEICIEGRILRTDIISGNATVSLFDFDDEVYDVDYMFVFEGIPDEVVSLKNERWVKLSGYIADFHVEQDDGYRVLIIRVRSAKIVR